MNFTENFREGKGWLSRQSIGKINNAFQVWSTYQLTMKTKRLIVPSFPLSIAIEPTTSCNLRCPECPSGLRSFTRPTGNISSELFKKIIDEINPWLSNLTFYFQGEPFLHPEFLDLIAYASSRGIYQTTSTNGHYLDELTAKELIQSGLDRVIISIDGLTQQSYQQYRVGGKLDKVLEGTKNLIEAKKKTRAGHPFIIFQFLVLKQNEKEIPQLLELGKKIGVDAVRLKTAQIYDYEHGSELIPDNLAYSRYKPTADGKWKIKNSWENKCWKMWSSNVITWDGRVLPCCFDKDGKYVMGNLNVNSFAEIWHGEKYNQFRAKILKSRADVDICRNCSEGLKVWA